MSPSASLPHNNPPRPLQLCVCDLNTLWHWGFRDLALGLRAATVAQFTVIAIMDTLIFSTRTSPYTPELGTQ